MKAVTHGAGDGYYGYMGGASTQALLTSDKAGTRTWAANPDGPLNTVEQVEVLTHTAVSTILGIGDYRVVVHDTPLESRIIRNNKQRHAETAAPCYADLVVDDVFMSWDFANGSSLRTFYRFRDFGSNSSATRSFGTWVQTKLQHYKVTKPESFDKVAAFAELRTSFLNNIQLFSQAMNNPKRKK